MNLFYLFFYSKIWSLISNIQVVKTLTLFFIISQHSRFYQFIDSKVTGFRRRYSLMLFIQFSPNSVLGTTCVFGDIINNRFIYIIKFLFHIVQFQFHSWLQLTTWYCPTLKYYSTFTYFVYKLVTKRVLPLKCQRCGHTWEYSGVSTHFANCSHCRTSVNIRKQNNVSLESESGIPTPNSPSKVAQTTETPASESNG